VSMLVDTATHWAGKFQARLVRHEPLAAHTTFRIGGPADFFIVVQTVEELCELVQRARHAHIPFFILGNGSNLLVRDGGWRGLVIQNRCGHLSLEESAARAYLRVESGVMLPGMANRLARLGWTGLEWAIGVPGTLGGAIVGNAGAHGACIAETVKWVTILDARGEVRKLPKTELAFGYRTSRFKRTKDEIVLSAELELQRDDPQNCIARMQQYSAQRRRTQPTEPSVGSMFKNPPGDAAGRLIDAAGLKGTRVGGVQVSPVHANFFVNRGGATASDVLQLIDIVKARVRDRFGVELELEIEVIGD